MRTRILLFLVVVAAAGLTVWAAVHFKAVRWLHRSANNLPIVANYSKKDPWAEAVEKVKADRGELMGGYASVEVPSELKHYSDRHWFLAAQVAEVEKNDIEPIQDYVELAEMISRGELVSLPAVTDTYVLFGVGQQADDSPFKRYPDNGASGTDGIEIYNEAQLAEAYKQLDATRSAIATELADLKTQVNKLGKRERAKRKELQKQITERQQALSSVNADKTQLDQFYTKPDRRQKMFRDYETLQTIAKNLAGRSFNLEVPSERAAMKLALLRSLRPAALKLLEEVAAAYHAQFDRPLPVSSLVRPEEYQRALRRVNRNAVLIDTPPHSTGLAFDIDYRYMNAAEQAFVMAELARLKNAGRIEAIRERNSNYHVFTFLNGTRPADELIAASLDEATTRRPVVQSHHASKSKRSEVRVQRSAKSVKTKATRNKVTKTRARRRG